MKAMHSRKNTTHKYQQRVTHDEEGVILILLVLMLVGLLTIVVFTVGLGDWTFRRAELQMASDTAASDAAATFCSTRRCYNYALVNALESVDRMGIRGTVNRSTFRTELQAAITDLRNQITSGVAYISGPGGVNQWSIDGLTIRVTRGRWWQEGLDRTETDPLTGAPVVVPIAPASVDRSRLVPRNDQYEFSRINNPSVRFEPKFEPFDRFDGTDWQTEAGNQGTPAFLAANAVYVELAFENYSPILSLGVPSAAATIGVESIATRLRAAPGLTFCAAPFGIPACSLVNNVGEYEPQAACQFDRFFTEEKRYCTQAELDANTCNVLPGSFYAPNTPGSACDASAPWYDAAQCECATTAQKTCPDIFPPGESCPEPWVRGISRPNNALRGAVEEVPCGQKFGQNSTHCSFNPWPKLTQVSDHYGVIGTTTTDIFGRDPALESTYQWILSNRLCVHRVYNADGTNTIMREPNTVRMKVGERFEIRPEGLIEAASDQRVWDAIWGQMMLGAGPPIRSEVHPKFFDFRNKTFGPNGFRELGYPWVIGRADDVNGFPFGAHKTFLDELTAAGHVRPYKNYGVVDVATGLDKQAVEPYECIKNNIPQYGVCNSNRMQFNNRCHRKHRWINPRDSQATCNLDAPFGASMWGNINGYCHPDRRPADDPYLEGEAINIGSVNYYAQWTHTTTFSSGEPWNCEESTPFMPCPVVAVGYGAEVGGYPRGEENSPISFYDKNSDYHPADIAIWQVKVPVIANVSPTATPCTGVGGNIGPDPQIKSTDEWRVIGFMRLNLFDNDIGKPPPAPPGPSWNTNNGGYEDIRVCDYGADADGNGVPDRYPWGFNPTYRPPASGDPNDPPANMGTPRNCNMVRARVACDPGLIAGDFSGLASEYREAPAIVYTH